MRKISIQNIDTLLAAIAGKMPLYLPVDIENGKGAKYQKWSEGCKLSSALNTIRSAKDFFFPQSEDLMAFKTEGKSIEIVDIRSETEDFVIFGVKACDVRAFTILDNVFLSTPVDTFYKNRREHGVIVSMACSRPAETCFCTTFGIDASEPEGDVVCYKTADAFYFDAKTEKGEKLLASLENITEACDNSTVEAEKEVIKERLAQLPLASLSADAFGAGKTDKYFDAPEWKEMAESCLACGTCTFVCPTCQCYDIKDFNTGHGVIRHRCWDSCMYSDFTKMSAGQPRLTQTERFRQRFMHKLVYYPENNGGLFSCVGCGRCVSKCPIGMNITKVMKKLGGKTDV